MQRESDKKFKPRYKKRQKPFRKDRRKRMMLSASREALQSTTSSLDNATYIVFDIETTGGNPEKNGITEICALRVKQGVVEDTFYSMINPGYPIPPIVRRMTGITNNMVRNKPPIEDIMEHFVKFIGKGLLVSHNTIGDMRFLRFYSEKVLGKPIDNFYLCTHLLSEKIFPDAPDKSLKGLATMLKLPGVDFHRAMADAQVTLQLFRVLISKAKDQSMSEVEQMIRYQGDYESGMRLGWSVSSDLLNSLPNKPGVFYLYDRSGRLIFLSSALNLRRDCQKLLRYTQLPRQMLKVILSAADLKFKETTNHFAAALLECEEAGKHKLRFEAVNWHQRCLQTIFMTRVEGAYQLGVGPVAKGAVAAFGPLADMKEAKQLVADIGARLRIDVKDRYLNLETAHAGAVLSLFNQSVPQHIEKLKRLSGRWYLLFFPWLRRRYDYELKSAQALRGLATSLSFDDLFQTSGYVFVPGTTENSWTQYSIRGANVYSVKRIKNEWQDYVKKNSGALLTEVKIFFFP